MLLMIDWEQLLVGAFLGAVFSLALCLILRIAVG